MFMRNLKIITNFVLVNVLQMINEKEIFANIKNRLGIEQFNEMQHVVIKSVDNHNGDMIIYAPTGSGKTLAYVVPMLKGLNDNSSGLQSVIIAPTRELVLQIYRVVKLLAIGMKVACCYGGHKVEDEKMSLQTTPAIVVSTPGRLLDHAQRCNIDLSNVRQVVIDEFDKCLELGFEDEMRQLFGKMRKVSRRILTSATVLSELPKYVRINNLLVHDFLSTVSSPSERMKIFEVISPEKDKLETLRQLILTINGMRTIVFLNHRDGAERVYTYLRKKGIDSGIYHGGMEQLEREKAIAMFRNESVEVLVTTDLASRGLDIDNVQNIIHYNLPVTADVYTHRNGRTARVDASGSVYVIISQDETCPEYIRIDDELKLPSSVSLGKLKARMSTIHFAAGRKEKISRGDIVGFIIANSDLLSSDIGRIDLYDHYTLVAIPRRISRDVVALLNNSRIKGKRVRITMAEQRLNV